MADIVSPEKRSQMMAGIKGKDTKPEVLVRKLLHSNGYRFRLHKADLPGKPDIVLQKHSVVIFVHGCFWHGHEDCHLFRLPKTRTLFWEKKISTNTARDVYQTNQLMEKGWRVLIIWECSLRGKTKLDFDKLAMRLENFIEYKENQSDEIVGTQRI